MTHVDLGIQGAKRKNDTELLRLMRQVMLDNPNETDRARIVRLWMDELDDVLMQDAIEYAGYNIARRVFIEKPVLPTEKKQKEPPVDYTVIQKRAKEIIEAGIILWTMQVPSIGKPLNECTFGELETAAPLTGKFLSRLARVGAPGALVHEVFRDEEHLQDFWITCQ